jgi:heat shock protein HslJ
VIADAFEATWPTETCARATSAPRLTGTVWRIRSIGGTALTWAPPADEPFTVFNAEDASFNASVGCNTLRGGFSVAANGAVSFGPLASTMMACPDELANREAAFASALQATAGHAIGGRALRLFDESGAVAVEFEALYVP